MRTGCVTVILDDDGLEICVLFRRSDGYPTGHGDELKEHLQGFTIVNDLSGDSKLKIANGMDCLAAQIVAHFKKEPRGFYLHRTGTRYRGEQYIYTVYRKNNQLMLRVQGGAIVQFGQPEIKQPDMPIIYDGLVEWFNPMAVESEWREGGGRPTATDLVEEQITLAETFETSDDAHHGKEKYNKNKGGKNDNKSDRQESDRNH